MAGPAGVADPVQNPCKDFGKGLARPFAAKTRRDRGKLRPAPQSLGALRLRHEARARALDDVQAAGKNKHRAVNKLSLNGETTGEGFGSPFFCATCWEMKWHLLIKWPLHGARGPLCRQTPSAAWPVIALAATV